MIKTRLGISVSSGVGNLIRTAVGFGGTIVSDADPRLAPLAWNGGPTQTMALMPGSLALDAVRHGYPNDLSPRALLDDSDADVIRVPVLRVGSLDAEYRGKRIATDNYRTWDGYPST